jgi:hypothetical protein
VIKEFYSWQAMGGGRRGGAKETKTGVTVQSIYTFSNNKHLSDELYSHFVFVSI